MNFVMIAVCTILVASRGVQGYTNSAPRKATFPFFSAAVLHKEAASNGQSAAASSWVESAALALPAASSGSRNILNPPELVMNLNYYDETNQQRPVSEEPSAALRKHYNLRTLIDMYLSSLKRYPLLTKASTAATVSIVGDLISQSMTTLFLKRVIALDLTRTLCFGLVGFFYNAPLCHFWYAAVAKLGSKLQQTCKLSEDQRVAAELIVDQTVGVLLYYPLYFYCFEFFSATLQGRAFQFLPLTLRGWSPIVSAMRANYAVWPFTQWISFRFVPVSLRVLITNMVEVVWNIYFCARVASSG